MNNLDFLKQFEEAEVSEIKINCFKSTFEDNIWILRSDNKKNDFIIDFNLNLKDGTSLLDQKNYKILYTLKKMILQIMINGQNTLNKDSITIQRILNILNFFNLVNFYDDGSFSKHGFQTLDKNQLLFIFNKRLKNSNPFFLFSGKERLDSLLRSIDFYLPDNPTLEDIKNLKLILKEKNINLQKELFPNLFIGVQFSLEKIFLNLNTNHKYKREYESYFRNDDINSDTVNSVIVSLYVSIKVLYELHQQNDKNLQLPFKNDLEFILNYDFQAKEIKHFETYPVDVIFKTMKQCLDFHFNYGNDIIASFNNFLDILEKQNLDQSNLRLAIDKKAIESALISALTPKMKKLGVNSYYLDTRDENYFNNFRNNVSLFSLLKVYYGCALFVVGALMARRQSEIKSLEIDCFDGVNQQLSFRRSKSHIHSFGIKDYISLPTIEIVGEMLNNISLISKRLKNNTNNQLFLFPKSMQPWNGSDDKHLYYEKLDNMYDYFNIDLIDGKRPYIRQHQLRRFFAMAFFWSKGTKSIDTLRWFLGHTNPEHVYSYIYENTQGYILNNVKAQYVAENFNEYSDLKDFIKNKYSVENFDIIDSNDLADYINSLIEDKQITVEPVFFEDGNNVQFNIIVKVKNNG